MAANDRIEAVHMRYADLSGNWWRHGNDSLRVELVGLALIEAEEANGRPSEFFLADI